MRWRVFYFLLSLLVLVPGLYSLARWGLRPSIDFRGGSVLTVKVANNVKDQELMRLVQQVTGEEPEIIDIKGSRQREIRMAPISLAKKEKIMQVLRTKLGQVEETHFASLGPALGRELLIKTITGLILATLGILLYISLRFREKSFGVCAVLAMLHDSLVLLGVFSLLGHFYQVEVSSLFVTALLTVLSFSVHDTVVVYDRIRELRHRHPELDFLTLADVAVTQTLTRSLNNSTTIILVLLALFLLGGPTIHWFSFALLVGMISGTYSSIFTAVPLLVVWKTWRKRPAGGK